MNILLIIQKNYYIYKAFFVLFVSMDSQDYLEVKVSVPDEDTGDIVVACLGDLGFDAFAYEEGVQKCYIQTGLFDEDAFLMQLGAILEDMESDKDICFDYEIAPMPKVNWNSEWEKTGFTPIECGSFVVLPSDAPCTSALTPIYLQPQMAFGTGHHHTTYMMMESMQDLAPEFKDASVMDLGCGTAVLAILAAKLGARQVEAIDINEVAVRSALENMRLNACDFPVICGDARDLKPKAYDILLCNIHRNIILEDMPLYASALRKGGKLLLSGFLEEDVAAILSCADANGFMSYDSMVPSVRSREGWYNLILRKVDN